MLVSAVRDAVNKNWNLYVHYYPNSYQFISFQKQEFIHDQNYFYSSLAEKGDCLTIHWFFLKIALNEQVR